MIVQSQLRDTFDRVVVVNLARRTERLAKFNALFAQWPFKPPQRFEAVDGLQVEVPAVWRHGPGAWGCMLSHRGVLKSALEDKVSSLFVLEDDAYPAPNFAARAADFLRRVPSDWDCLMFGAEHMAPPTVFAPGIVRCVSANRTHAFAIRGKMMSSLLQVWHHFTKDHCDLVLAALMPHFEVYAPDPFLIGQDAGYSDITERTERLRFLPALKFEATTQREQLLGGLVNPCVPSPSPTVVHIPTEARSLTGASRYEEQNAAPPFFIVGHERSGTTLMAALFDRHSRIAVPPETHFFMDLCNVRAARDMNDRVVMVDHLLKGTRIGDLKLSREELLSGMVDVEPTWANLFLVAMKSYGDSRGKKIVGEKTPKHSLLVPQLLELFPKSKVFWVVRDGRDTVLSMMKAPWKSHSNLALHALQWRQTTDRMLAFESRFPDRISRVRFEDLVTRPAIEMGRACRFIGVDFEVSQLDSSIQTGVVPEWEMEWKGRVFTPPDPGRIGTAARELPAQALKLLNFLTEPSMRQLGYSVDDDAAIAAPRDRQAI